MFVWLTLLALLVPSLQSDTTLRRYTALNFPGDSESFITLLPDTAPFTEVFSFCGWVRKLGSAGWPILLSYGGNEIRVQDEGGHNCIFGSCLRLSNKFTVPRGTWYHYCSSWSSESGEFREYVDGELVASRATAPGRQLQTGLQFTLGNWGEGGLQGLEFEGHLFNINFFAKELSRSEVEKMAGDMCALNEEFDEGVHSLSWEDILDQPRNGTVTETDTGCLERGEVRSRLEEARSGVRQSEKELEQVASRLNLIVSRLKTETEQTLDWAEKGENQTTAELVESTASLGRNIRELNRVTTLLERTAGILEEGGTGQDGSGESDTRDATKFCEKLVGMTITKQFIELMKSMDGGN